ncbi:MAG: alkaline phosphatase [Bacteroidales bacterium]|nr:alkaline phosphatase [Bacteroidales bacterium]
MKLFRYLKKVALVILSVTVFSVVAIAGETPKYIFFFIGDGMSISQIRLAEAALSEDNFRADYSKETGRPLLQTTLTIRKMTATGMATTNAENRFITGSAAAATALATGHKTTINTISMNGARTAALETIAEKAKKKGMKVAVITSVSIDHATPACFYAHTEDRNNYEIIGEQLINSNFDYFAGGSVKHNKYKNKTFDEYKTMAAEKGYKYVNTRSEFDALDKNSGKVIATIKMLDNYFNDGSSLPYNIDLDDVKSVDDVISLAEFTQKGIDMLENKNGFFMMVEGGKIDWTCHANDAVTGVYEIIAFDEAISKAFEFYKKHPKETLIVVTGDHECGGLALGYAGTHYETSFDILANQKLSFMELNDLVAEWRKGGVISFDEAMKIVKAYFGLGDEAKGLKLNGSEIKRLQIAFAQSMKKGEEMTNEEKYLNYGGYEPFTVTVTHILNNKAGIDWTSYSHTAVPVPVFSIGAGSDVFNGYYDNTDIPKKIMELGNIK